MLSFENLNMGITNKKANIPPIGKLLLVLMLLFAGFPATEGHGAENVYSLTLKNVAFSKAVKAIETKTGYSFVYNTGLVDANTKVSLSVSNGSIDRVVGQLIKGLPLRHEIKGKRIFLSKRQIEGKPASQSDAPKGRTVSGKVLDENGEPLIGATISIPEADLYAVTDADGNYVISVPEKFAKAKIQVSYVGFDPYAVGLKGREELDVTMKSSSQLLQDLVVVGYGTQKKESLTSAISVVSADDISRSAATNTSGALVGKVAGINSRMSDGRPGASTTLNIRNMGTPLYVVDGVQMDEGQFNNIDFNDIESISVLKDASAAIYGVRSANGVVVVTTKSGKRNTENRVNVNAYYGWQNMMRFPKPSDAATYVGALVQSATVTGKPGNYTYEDYQKWKQGTEKGYRGFDWYDYIFTSAPQYYVSANTSGGSEKINYYFAASHLRQDAIIRNYGNFHRTNIQVNIDANITDNFKIGTSINGRVEETNHPAIAMNDGNDDYWTAIFAVYRNLPTVRPFANDNPDYPARTAAAGYTNFAIFGKTGYQIDRWKVLQSNFTAEWEVIKNLKLKGLFSYFFANRRYDNQENSFKLYNYDANTDTYPVVLDYKGHYKYRNIQNNEVLNAQFSANYDVTIADKHKISAFLGSEIYKANYPGFSVSSIPQSNSLDLIYVDDITGFADSGNNTQARTGFMGRFNYDFSSRYLFEFAARYDGSWKFPPNHRWGFFPSVSGGWRISEENFWKEDLKEVFSNLKVRASYGVMGDDNVGGYSAYDFMDGYNYNSGGAVLQGDWVVGSSTRNLPVTNFSWIKSKVVDLGVDFGFFNNQLTGTFDLFRRMRTGLPSSRYDKVLPSEVGFGIPAENLNSDMQKGVDGSLVWQSKVGDFSYSVGGNFTFARSYNWHQYKPRFGNSWDYYVYSANERVQSNGWGYECEGQFQSWEQIENWPVDVDGKGNTTMRPGDLILKDLNGDGIITTEDQHAIGYQAYKSGNPPLLNFAFNLGFSWKGIDFAADFTGAAMQTFWANWEMRVPFIDTTNNPQYLLDFKNMWHLADINDPNSELIPGKYPMGLVGASFEHPNYHTSSFWTRNVRYLKLRNMEIGYTFPQKWTKKAGMQKLRVYTLMQNLFSIDNIHDMGIDPEIADDAGYAYPTNRVINFGVNVTF